MTNFITAALLAALVAGVAYGLVATGPDCPDMPETYLGWCND